MSIFIISWFVVGLICMMLLFAIDLRGKSYNEYYFKDTAVAAWTSVLFGYFSVFFVFCAYEDKHHHLKKLIYKIVNIGIDVKEDEYEN